jgi:DNA polymerase I
MKKLIIIDGNAIIHRAYHALPPFRSPEGELVNAVFGFGSMLINILGSESPDYIAVSFDTKEKTFRHEEYKEYKATRKKAPDDLYTQMPHIKDLVKAFDIPIFELPGFEADDVLGALAKQAEAIPDINTYIVTGDMDALQLVNDKTFVMTPVRGFQEYKIYAAEQVVEKYGLTPSQIVDMKALQGDASDNIKGVEGVGKKTAQTLLQKYKTLENIYENLDQITGKLHERLRDNKEDAIFSKRLATIITDLPVKLEIEKCQTNNFDYSKIENFFQTLQFHSLVRRLSSLKTPSAPEPEKVLQVQESLF